MPPNGIARLPTPHSELRTYFASHSSRNPEPKTPFFTDSAHKHCDPVFKHFTSRAAHPSKVLGKNSLFPHHTAISQSLVTLLRKNPSRIQPLSSGSIETPNFASAVIARPRNLQCTSDS